jgi:hypothetical protein
MMGSSRKLSWVLFALLLPMVVSAVLISQTVAAATVQATQIKTLDRDEEPVIVTGSKISALLGTPVDDLFVYTYSGNSLSGQIPVQVDEVTAAGNYTTTEDGLLDLNDEIVFMAVDLGDQPTDTSALTGLPISPNWYEIEVIDPLTGKRGWAYLVSSNTLAPTFSGNYVDYNGTTKRITTNPEHYELGLATSYVGLDYLTLNGDSTNILDRTKLRAVFDAGILGTVTLTEEDLENPEIVLVKDGPVRVILRQAVTADPGGPITEASLSTTNLAYASLLQATASVSFTLPGFVDIASVRTSVDFNSAVSGARFYNANTPSNGVLIDGQPDVVAATPLSNWTQVSTTTGRLVQVSDPTPVGGTAQKNYYCDDDDPNPLALECDGTKKTGDDVSYGDAGVLIEGSVNQSFMLKSWLFVPAAGQGNVGETYQEYSSQPLKSMAFLQGERPTIFLPLILKNSQ